MQRITRKTGFWLGLSVVAALLLALVMTTQPAQAYVEAPHSLGQVITLSTNIMVCRVEKVDREKRLIIYRKVRDLKGQWNQDLIKHNLSSPGFNAREWQYPMEWAEVGKTAVFFHNGGAGEMCIGNYWYQIYPGGEWWTLSHGEPFLLRSFAGNIDKLASAVTDILANKEVIVPCMVDGNKDDLHLRRAKIQRLRASLKLGDYNEKRDFVGWGGEDFRRLTGMPGFTHISSLPRVDPEAQAISSLDIDGDGKPDLCLVGASKVVLLQNGGESLNEINLPNGSGCRAAVWADYNGDGKPDLLLATASGPRLYTNMGGNVFRDDTHLLPYEPGYNLTAAAWIDQNGDGRPDILLGNGYHGLRLLRNGGPIDNVKAPMLMGEWQYCGPFPNSNGAGFAQVFPPEQGVNLKGVYGGRSGKQVGWKEGKFQEGEINNLALFEPNNNVDAVIYLYREIDCAAATDLPVSLGSDDTLTVWLNGQRILAENVQRACAPDQHKLTLKLKAGKNQLLMKVCQGTGDWAFYFKAEGALPRTINWKFEDVSASVGLGPNGIGSTIKGDTLTVCDVNGDGKPDFLYGAGAGLLAINDGKRFVEVADSGINYRTGRVGPVFGDFLNDGHQHLFVPQTGGCKLFRNDGKGKFTDITAASGLDKFTGRATSAAWGDVDNDGHLDLVIGCLREPNRYFRNKGDGTFEDASEVIGLDQKVFNTQAVCLVDLNGDGVLDMVFNNEGQDGVVLLGNPETLVKRIPVTLQINGKSGVVGSQIKMKDKSGKLVASRQISGGDGRGGQAAPLARFALAPGTYNVEVLYSSGVRRGKEIQVTDRHLKGVIDEQTPTMD
jgi:FG-GAP-like repeat/FG-GAP repeat